MRNLTFAIVLLLLSSVAVCHAQHGKRLISRQVKKGLYIEKYKVDARDTSVWEGEYTLNYKGKVIEHGQYKKGQRTGVWTFYNIHKQIEFRYDYDQRLPFQIMPHEGYTYTARTFPSMFLGSPLVPYHFIAQNTYYPLRESGNYKDCKVVLALEINAQGRMTGYRLTQKSKEAFNETVLKAASQMPKHWRWVPARRDGRNVPSDYLITVIFEAVD